MAQGIMQSAKEDETILSLTVKQADFGQKTNNSCIIEMHKN